MISVIILSKKVKEGVCPWENQLTIANYAVYKICRKGDVLCDMNGKTVHNVNNVIFFIED